MRNRDHNRRGVLNTSNPDWNEDRGTYGNTYRNHGYENDRSSGNFNYGDSYGYGSSIGRRYESYGEDRNYPRRGAYDENQYTRDSGFNRGRYQGDRDEGFQGYGNDWRSSYGNDYSRDYLNYGSERGANDRASDEYRYRNFNDRNTYGGSFGGGSYGSDYNRNRRNYNDNDRNWWDRTSDEVSSWFGDEDAERRREWDKYQSGQHRGKGPKGYTRSDERIKEDINDRLSDDVFIDASEIEVAVNQGDVTLTGTVNDRDEKRRAEDIAEQVLGVKNVENRIRLQATSLVSPTKENREAETSTTVSNRNRIKETV
jgi:osmotically-inducible protein OsmY